MDVFAERRRRVLEALQGVAVFFAAKVSLRNRDVHHEYRQDSDLFYLTGLREPDAVLVLAPANAAHQQILFINSRDPEKEIWDGARLGIEGAVDRIGVQIAYPIAELAAKLPALIAGNSRLYHGLGRDPAADACVLDAIATVRGRGRSPSIWPTEIVDPATVLHEMRARKTEVEIGRMRRAAEITRDAHIGAMRLAAPGRYEYEIEALIREVCRRNGSERLAYPPIVGSGPNATVLHYRTNDRRIEDGDLVLVDAGCELDYYAADVTRTFPASGTFSKAQRNIYEIVLDAQLAVIEGIKPGATIDDLHRLAIRRIVMGLVQIGLLHGDVDQLIADKAYRAFYMHRTSHWIGLDVHDVGLYYVGGKPRPLEEGMALTVEPGIYIRKDQPAVPPEYWGIGVRIEDDVVVTATGVRELTADIPKTAADVERACQA